VLESIQLAGVGGTHSPTQPKFRTLRKANAGFAKVWAVPAMRLILQQARASFLPAVCVVFVHSQPERSNEVRAPAELCIG
jgi:hypothetical protein